MRERERVGGWGVGGKGECITGGQKQGRWACLPGAQGRRGSGPGGVLARAAKHAGRNQGAGREARCHKGQLLGM